MLVCTCCGKWQIKVDQYRRLYRIRHYGVKVDDVRTIQEVENVLARSGMTLANFKEEQ